MFATLTTDRLTGGLLVLMTALMALASWTHLPHAGDAAAVVAIFVLATLTPRVRPTRRISCWSAWSLPGSPWRRAPRPRG